MLRAVSIVSTGEGYYFFTVTANRRKSEFYLQMHGKWAVLRGARAKAEMKFPHRLHEEINSLLL